MRFLPLLFCAILAPLPASANELLRVYELGVKNDTQMQAAEFAREAARQATRQTGGALLPQIVGTGNIGTQDDKITPKGSSTFEVSSEPYNLTVQATQVLFNAELWNRWQQADDRVAAAEASYHAAEQNLVLRATEAYFNVLGAADNVRFADAEKKAVERQLELAKKRFEVGLSAITDVQEAQARYDLTVAQMIEAEQVLANAREALAVITGAGDVRVEPLREEIPLQGPTPDSVTEWLKVASDNNLQLLQARAQAEIARQDVDISRAGHYVTLSAVGRQSLGESSGFNTGEYEQNSIMLQATLPIFAGGTTQANVNASKNVHGQRLAELEGARREVERSTRNAYQGVIAGVSRVQALKQAVLSNTTALQASEVGLEVGARTAVDVLNAQRELYRAQRDYARARYDYLLNILRLKSAAGQLTGKDLNEIDSLLVRDSAAEVAG